MKSNNNSICIQLPAKATGDCCQSGNMTQGRPGLGGLHATPTASVDISATQSIDINIVIFSSHSVDNVRSFFFMLYTKFQSHFTCCTFITAA